MYEGDRPVWAFQGCYSEIMMWVARLSLLLTLLVGASTARAGDDDRPLMPPSPLPAGGAAKALLSRWLDKGTEIEAAWGAWEAGERDLVDLAAAVALRLGKEVRREEAARRSLLEMILMDAAIRLRADVPAETLRRRGFSTPGVATYLCQRKAGPAHLAAFEAMDGDWRVGGQAWFAIGGCLHEAKVRDFAQRLIGNWKLERMLRVWDTDGPHPAYRRPSGSVPGDAFATVPQTYPPMPQRWLSLRSSDKRSRLVGGLFPVYGSRTVHRGKRIGWGITGGRPAPDMARRAWLLAWLDGAKMPDLPQWAVVDLKWSGGRRFWTRHVGAAVRDVHDRWRQWREALVTRGLLKRQHRKGLVPKVRWTIRDERRVRGRPIPPMPEVRFDPRIPLGR